MELRDYLHILRRRKRLLGLVVALVVGGAIIGSALQTPVYAADTEVGLDRRSSQSLFENTESDFSDPLRVLQTEIRVITSHPVRLAVRQKLGYDAKISARPAGQSNVIVLTAENTDRQRAVAIADAFAAAYIESRRDRAVEDLQDAAVEVQAKITEIQQRIDAIPPPVAATDDPPAGAASPLRQSLLQQQSVFQDKLNELQVNASLQSGGAEVVSPAVLPESPVRPRPVRNVAVALVLGLFIGLGVVFLADYLDDTIRTKEDMERAEPTLPVLSVIPSVVGWRSKVEPRLVSVTDPTSAAAEAYRSLRTSVQFTLFDHPVRTLQVTSPNASEGKTTTLANLAVALAGAGHRVTIVCCDLRRPRVHEFFGLGNGAGFTSVLLGETSMAAALQPVPGVNGLSLLASGPVPPNPSELLQSQRAAEILKFLEADDGYVLLDSPPVLPVSDAAVLSKLVHGTLLVCAAGTTGRRDLNRATELLRQVQAPLIGLVLNGVADDASYGSEYGSYGGTPSLNGTNRLNGKAPQADQADQADRPDQPAGRRGRRRA